MIWLSWLLASRPRLSLLPALNQLSHSPGLFHNSDRRVQAPDALCRRSVSRRRCWMCFCFALYHLMLTILSMNQLWSTFFNVNVPKVWHQLLENWSRREINVQYSLFFLSVNCWMNRLVVAALTSRHQHLQLLWVCGTSFPDVQSFIWLLLIGSFNGRDADRIIKARPGEIGWDSWRTFLIASLECCLYF